MMPCIRHCSGNAYPHSGRFCVLYVLPRGAAWGVQTLCSDRQAWIAVVEGPAEAALGGVTLGEYSQMVGP